MAKGNGGNIPEEFRVSGGTAEDNGKPDSSDPKPVAGGDQVIDPSKIGSAPGNGSEPGQAKKRGRPKGQGNSPKTEAAKTLHLKNLDFVILNAHLLLSKAISAPELAIDQDEANTLGASVKEVLSQYDVGMSDKAAAWTNLIMVSTAIYGGRLYRVSERKAKEREQRKRDREAQQGSQALG